jgi:hypothetical protein
MTIHQIVTANIQHNCRDIIPSQSNRKNNKDSSLGTVEFEMQDRNERPGWNFRAGRRASIWNILRTGVSAAPPVGRVLSALKFSVYGSCG